jgi:hypothetical protein
MANFDYFRASQPIVSLKSASGAGQFDYFKSESPYDGATYGYTKSTSGALSFSGNAIKQAQKYLSGSISFSGAVAKYISKIVSGTISFSGIPIKTISKRLSGSISFSGNALKTIYKNLTGLISFAGNITPINKGRENFPIINRDSLAILGKNIKSLIIKAKDIL